MNGEACVTCILMTNLPTKITPDSLLETFVEVRYTLLAQANGIKLEESFGPVLAPDFIIAQPAPPADGTPPLDNEPDEVLLYGQGIIFRIRTDSISFTCSEGYLGWPQYQLLIQQVLTRIFQTGRISKFTRLGLRYINALPWAPLNQQLQVKLPDLPGLSTPEHTLYQTTLRTPDGYRVVLVLTDRPDAVEETSGPVSLFDVDIMWEPAQPITELAELFHQIDRAHTREKEVFFGLLSPEFLRELNPQYE